MNGAYLLKKRRPDDVRRAFEYFQEAIRLDPGFAEPYYGAAMFYNVSAAYGALPSRNALPQAEASNQPGTYRCFSAHGLPHSL